MTALPPWARERVAVADAAALAALVTAGPPPGACFVPTGGGTRLGRGARPRADGVLLDLGAFQEPTEHAIVDLTVTVGAGRRVCDLQNELGAHGQWLPADPFPPYGSTIGGLVATDRRGLLSAGLGSVRDHLLGITCVDGAGREISAGGRVVKNVAGYDLMKLLTGSLGELGVLVRATFRLLPRPRAWRAVVCRAPGDEVLGRLPREGRAWFPLALLRGSWEGEELVLAVFAGSEARVSAQVEKALRALGGECAVLEDTAVETLLEDFSRRLVPADRTRGWGGALPAFLATPDLAATFARDEWVADLLLGHLWWFPANASPERVDAVRRGLRPGEGHLHLEGPPSHDPPAPAWGTDPGPERPLWEGVKRAFDPDGRLASGRLPGGV